MSPTTLWLQQRLKCKNEFVGMICITANGLIVILSVAKNLSINSVEPSLRSGGLEIQKITNFELRITN